MSRSTRRGVTILAALPIIVAATAATPALPAVAQDAGCTVTIWGDELTHLFLKSAAEAYTEQTGVQIELVSRPFTTIVQEYETQVPAGTGPDLLIGWNSLVPGYVASGIAAPLELGDKLAEFVPAAQTAALFDGQTYMTPLYVENLGMLRNPDLVPTAPATMEEVAEVGQALKDAGKTEYIISTGFDPNTSNWYNLYPWMMSSGAPIFGRNEDGSWNVQDLQLGGEGGHLFATQLAEWGQTGVLDPETNFGISVSLFTEGKAPFLVTGPWDVPAVRDAGSPYVVDPIPTSGPNPAGPMVGVYGLILNPKSECALAAADFATSWIPTKEAQLMINQDSTHRPALAAAASELVDDADIQGFAAAGKDAAPLFADPKADVVFPILGPTLNAIIRGQGDPISLWDEMVAQAEAALAE
jgi:arabinogalactan oligomer/maltooligosaccharide transport system substrate-binding protein